MSHPYSCFYSAEDDQRNIDDTELAVGIYSMPLRDNNINNGPGTLTVNNDNRIIQQSRSTARHIRGTEEEEAEYEEYGEYKRGDVQLLERIHHEERVFNWERGRYMECERGIFIGKILTGDGKGAIVTVESYKGREAPEGDLSVYQLIYRHVWLSPALIDQIPSKYQRRRQQPIYLFVRPPPLNLPKSYISLHFWSLHEDGQSQLSDESCDDFGLFTKPLYFTYDFHSFSWSTAHYKRLHEYQLSRGFDPKTINFARYLGYDHHIFQLTDDSDRFEDVLEAKRKCRNGVGESIINPVSEGLSNTRDQAQQLVGDTDFCGTLQTQEPGGLESGNHPDQDLHEYVTITIDIASNGPRPRSSGSALGGHDGTDLLAWNAIDVAHPVPSIDLVNNTITITHDAGNAQNIGTYVAPSGTADSRLHNDGPTIQLIPPVRR
ncbi:hypothetical protein PM082_006193 [Marasmius tenuissimus]|nr:hypothetical protein PM082_006193 [Marasmius tenuissimus]